MSVFMERREILDDWGCGGPKDLGVFSCVHGGLKSISLWLLHWNVAFVSVCFLELLMVWST